MSEQPKTQAMSREAIDAKNNPQTEPEPVDTGPAPTLFGNPERAAREARIAEYLTERAQAAAVEAAENGGNEFEQREAATKVAKETAADLGNPQGGDSLSGIVGDVQESLRDEVKGLREQLAAQNAKIGPAESASLSTEEYFAARAAGKLQGIRKPRFGMGR